MVVTAVIRCGFGIFIEFILIRDFHKKIFVSSRFSTVFV